MITEKQLDNYLSILASIIISDMNYGQTYKVALSVSDKDGSAYQDINQDNLVILQHTFDERPLYSDVRYPNVLTMFGYLQQMALKFSVLTGMSTEEWDDLIKYLYVSHARVITPGLKQTDNIPQLLRVNPWFIILLLMEYLPITKLSFINDQLVVGSWYSSRDKVRESSSGTISMDGNSGVGG